MKFREYVDEGMGSIKKAYFISPFGKIVDCERTHIEKIISNPGYFGYTKEEIEEKYNRYNERIGTEGKAREEILIELLNKGWIHLRRHKNFWNVSLNKINKKTKNHLQRWAEKVQTNLYGFKERDKFTPVKIQSSNTRQEYTVKEISSDVLFRTNEMKEEE